ncbi:polysialyltransferase family glycosyltransferase [Streptomyces sp. NBC_01190]|uniref:polysialyltransferase family glycosyltransferase n=1 Tax=Streptomyces sp. NBC_01190 TaxID=2903767 RepID=UPI003870AE3E|nr:alpha-2,8-polysialyltransferase family protein [Streptomyces sp. NBC_01190]
MRRTAQIFAASSLYGAASMAAAIDADLFRPADRRILLAANTAPVPETAPSLTELPGFERLRSLFDEVISWNEVIHPFHPGGWSTRGDDSPLWERHIRRLWNLGDDRVEIAGDTVASGPAFALAQMFPDSPVDAIAAGLAVYGPTRAKLDPIVGTRVRRLIQPDLIPGLPSLLLSEFGVAVEPLPADRLLKALGDVSAPKPEEPAAGSGPVLLLGQYLAAQGLLTEEEEEELYLRMVRGAVELGHRELVFVPHPAAPPRWSRRLEDEAARLGAELASPARPAIAEALFTSARPALVVGCFSTALFTAAGLYGLPVARIGTGELLARLPAYTAPQRIALTLADTLLPDLADPAAVAGWRLPPAAEVADAVAGLRDAVAFCMQPQLLSGLRPAAEDYLTRHLDARTWRYFKRSRLASLALPGAVPAQLAFIPRHPTVRRMARRAKALGMGAQD